MSYPDWLPVAQLGISGFVLAEASKVFSSEFKKVDLAPA